MRINFTPNDDYKYMHYQIAGAYTFNEAIQVAKSVRAECDRRGYTKAFIDLRGITNDIPQLDRFKLGKQAAIIWGSYIQVALLGSTVMVNKFFENVAVNRQSQVRVFTEMEDVTEWLGIEKAN